MSSKMKRPLPATNTTAGATAPHRARHSHPPVLAFEEQLLPATQGYHGPLANQIYPLDSRWRGHTASDFVALQAAPRGGTSMCCANAGAGGYHIAAHTAEVIIVEDDEDDNSLPSATLAGRPCTPHVNGASIGDRSGHNSSGGSSKSSSRKTSSKSSRACSSAASQRGDRFPTDEQKAGVSVASASEDRFATDDNEEASDDNAAISGAHTKSLWLHGRQRLEHMQKHLTDLRTRVAIGKVSLRNTVFPSASAASAFIRAVSRNRMVTSFTLNAPEMPEDQFAAICQGLRSCSHLNHIDCNTIGNKPMRPAALQQLLRSLRSLPDLREVNLSGNEFASPALPRQLEATQRSAGPPPATVKDGLQLLKDLVLGGVLCLLARECGLRQVRSFLVWVLNRCHCLRLRQLDIGASSKLITTLVPGETFDEELLRRVSRLSKTTWRMGKVIGDYVPSFKAVDLWTPHMTHTFWLYCLLDAMIGANATAVDGPLKDGPIQVYDPSTPSVPAGGSGRLPLIRVWGVPTDHTIASPAHAANFRYHLLLLPLRFSTGGRASARLAGLESTFSNGGGHADSLAEAFGAYDACVDAARVEPAVFAFAAWRQQQRQHNRYLKPGQWVEVINAKKEDKKFFYSSIGVVQQTIMGSSGTECVYQVEYLGLPPRSFTRLTLGGSPAPADVAAVLRSTVRVAIVPAEKVRPLVFLLPNDSWTVQELQAQHNASNCVLLSDAYGLDMKCPAYGGQVVYAHSVACQSLDSQSSGYSGGSSSTSSNSGSSSTSVLEAVSEDMMKAAALHNRRWHIQLNCQHLEFSAKQLLHPRQLFCRFGMEGPVTEGGSADLFEPLGVTSTPPLLEPPPAKLSNSSDSCSSASSTAGRKEASFAVGGEASASKCTLAVANSQSDACLPLRSSPCDGGIPPIHAGTGSPKARERLPASQGSSVGCPSSSPGNEVQESASVVPRKKSHKSNLAVAEAAGPSNDHQTRPGRRAPHEASVVVELSDDETQELQTRVAHHTHTAGASAGKVAGETIKIHSARTSKTEDLSGVSEAPAGGDESTVEVAGVDGVMWQTVLTCARCRMPLASPPHQAAGGASADAPVGAVSPGHGDQAREGVLPIEGGVTAGVRRRFRAYVRRLTAERSQAERRRLDRILEDLQLPLPYSSDPGDASAGSMCRNARSGSRAKNGGKCRQDRQISSAEHEAFERCIQVVGAVAAPVTAGVRATSSSSCSSSGSSMPQSPRSASAARERAQAEGRPSVSLTPGIPLEAGEKQGSCVADSSTMRIQEEAGDQEVNGFDCFCTCNECSCCLKRTRLCRPNDTASPGNSSDPSQNLLRLCDAEYENELSPREWEVVRKAMRILFDRGVIGLVAHDKLFPGSRIRLLAVPPTFHPDNSAAAADHKGSSTSMGFATSEECLEDGDELQELRRVLEQGRDCPYSCTSQPRQGSVTESECLATGQARHFFSAQGFVLCNRCIGDGRVSELTLPGLLDRYRSTHTDSTCNAPACAIPNGRCGCRGIGKRRRTSTAKSQVFGWSRNSAFHGISSLAQACNMSQEDAQATYSDYASMQIESLQRSARQAC
ncbi:hypothetical protein Efla_001094 [Eimeria flavescens]